MVHNPADRFSSESSLTAFLAAGPSPELRESVRLVSVTPGCDGPRDCDGQCTTCDREQTPAATLHAVAIERRAEAPSMTPAAPPSAGMASGRVRPICHCLKVYEDEIRQAIDDHGLSSVRQVTGACGAGGGCTACHRHIKRFLAEAAREREAVAAEPLFGFA